MKRSGRTLKQRLYGLKHIGSYLRRARHFRGHGVHSPYVYNIVREVFMQRRLKDEGARLHAELLTCGISPRRAMQLSNLTTHCNYTQWCIDSLNPCNILFATLEVKPSELERYAIYAREHGATLCIMQPYNDAERWATCRAIIDGHPSTTVDNRAYLLVFNNHLPKQRFRL